MENKQIEFEDKKIYQFEHAEIEVTSIFNENGMSLIELLKKRIDIIVR